MSKGWDGGTGVSRCGGHSLPRSLPRFRHDIQLHQKKYYDPFQQHEIVASIGNGSLS